jgi:hypothetical protein
MECAPENLDGSAAGDETPRGDDPNIGVSVTATWNGRVRLPKPDGTMIDTVPETEAKVTELVKQVVDFTGVSPGFGFKLMNLTAVQVRSALQKLLNFGLAMKKAGQSPPAPLATVLVETHARDMAAATETCARINRETEFVRAAAFSSG